MNDTNNSISINGFQLKYIALFFMTIDHIGAVLLTPGTAAYAIARAYGRIAFPIYCFLLVEGFFHTSSHLSYLKRLFLFALISELPFDMALFHLPAVAATKAPLYHQNIFFTLFFGFLAMYLIERFLNSQPLFAAAAAIGAIALGQVCYFDYGAFGIMVILLFYAAKRFYPWVPPVFSYLFALVPLLAAGGWRRFFVLFSVPLFLLYNKERGNMLPGRRTVPFGKYFFYLYYPLHLLILAFIYWYRAV
ncbi:MAG: TraX family protein [Lachnospiraceae bacterium]|nr:TraX family protein [Lachnospiraceae bacterium]